MQVGAGAGDLFRGTNRFEIRRRLGEGGFGVVYEAYDRVRRSAVALKTLRQTDPRALRQFKAEFRSLADLVHPRLATLYELFCEDDHWFFTMKLIDGCDFLAYLRTPTRAHLPFASTQAHVRGATEAARPMVGKDDVTLDALPSGGGVSARAASDHGRELRLSGVMRSVLSGEPSPSSARASLPSIPTTLTFQPDGDRIRPLVAQLAEGLVALHAAGMLHRDIKPSNVLVDRDGHVIVLDFGLVTSLSVAAEDRARTTIAGTPAYMAPEQGMFGAVTGASDWYAVGVMLYEALTGCLPVEGEGLSVIVHKQTVDPIPPRLLARDVPSDLEELALALLARDPADRPSGQEVLQRLGKRGSTRPPARAIAREAQFVGRDAELAALESAFADVRRGALVEVHVQGRSGIGKSALVRAFLDRAGRRTPDLLVLTARCYEQESVPFKAWDGIVDAIAQRLEPMNETERARVVPPSAGALARIFPSLRGVDGFSEVGQPQSPDPRELFARAALALRELLANLARDAPLVLFIDDMQWGDVDSARLLADVLRGADPPSLLLVVAYRSEDADASPVLQRLRERRGTRSIVVSELSEAEGRALVDAIAPLEARGSDVVESVLRDASGSPLFIDEIARHLDSYTEAERTAGMLDVVLSKRVALLSPSARTLLEVVAVAGRPVARGVAVDVAEIGSEEPAALAALRAGRLLRSSAGSVGEVETFHDRVRSVVVGAIDAVALRAYHRALAVALEADEATDPERLAIHFEAAGDATRARGLVERAADLAFDALGFDRAARLYRKAIDMHDADDARVPVLRARLGDALVNAGRGLEGARELVRAAQRAGRIEALDLRRRGGEQFMLSGHIDEGKATHKTVLDALHMRAPESRTWVLVTFLLRRLLLAVRGFGHVHHDASEIDRERLLRMDTLWSLTIGMAIVDQMRALALQSYHLLLALRTGEPSRLAYALAAEIAYCAARGTHSRARVEHLLPMARDLATRAGRPEPAAMVTASEGIALYAQARYREARVVLEQGARMLRETCAGVTWHLGTTHAYLLFTQRAMGEMKVVAQRYEQLRREAEERGDLYSATLLATRLAHLAPLADDDAGAASAAIEAAIGRWSASVFTMQHCYALTSRVDCDLYVGDAQGGLDRLDATWPRLARSLSLRNTGVLILCVDARARLLVARAKEVPHDPRIRARARKDIARLRREPSPLAITLVALLDAALAIADRRDDEAIALLEIAEARATEADLALHAACARRRRGELLGGAEGGRLVAESDARLRAEDVTRPDRYARLFVPA